MTLAGPAARVLVVDDDALIALDTGYALSEGGYTVVGPAYRIEAALRLATAEAIDAAVLDVNLAGVAVWPVASALRDRGIPFVLLTGFTSDLSMPAALQGVPRLSKPIQRSRLLDAVASLMVSRPSAGPGERGGA